MPAMSAPLISHCHRCGAATENRLPGDGDTRLRAVCTVCHLVHYQNPLLVVGTLPYTADGRVLLCQRNIEPRLGRWTLPAGFMELDETLRDGALRETREEAGLHAGRDVQPGPLFSLLDVPHVGQVHVFYLARLLRDELPQTFGHETRQLRLFALPELPWRELAFRTVSHTLRCFVQDWAQGGAQGRFGLHERDMSQTRSGHGGPRMRGDE